MNRILQSHIDEFATQFGYQSMPQSDVFERFCNFALGAELMPQLTVTRDIIEDSTIGNGNDWGIDGLYVLVNKRPVSSIADINDTDGMELKVDIILIQAKTSESIDTGELSKFLNGAKDVMRYISDSKVRKNLPPANQDLLDKLSIIDALYSKPGLGSDTDASRPRLRMYYCVAGSNPPTADHKARIAEAKESLDKMNLTNDNLCTILAFDQLQKIYRNNRTRTECTLIIDDSIAFHNNMKGIQVGYLCLIAFPEFKKLMIIPADDSSNEDKINKSIFEDNVRDYQGDNRVNTAIDKSIKNGDAKLFAVLNNGITIIARRGRLTGKSLWLQDYQIVNGCQTCHVLFKNREVADMADLMLTVKIIFSVDQEIRDKIIVANNNQTQVQPEQLTSLLETQRNIEEYYKAETRYEKLYFERRSKQYKYGEEKIPASQIVTIPLQLMAYVSMVLGKPHMTSQYYGVLLKEFNGSEGKEKIINPEAHPAFYYTSALCAIKRDALLYDGKLPDEARHVKHHLLHAFPLVASGKEIPRLNSNAAETYCDNLCAILISPEKCLNAFNEAYKLITDTLGRTPERSDLNDANLAQKISTYWHKARQKNILTGNNNKATDNAKASGRKIPEEKPMISGARLTGPKIVGKIDLEAINASTRPKKRRK